MDNKSNDLHIGPVGRVLGIPEILEFIFSFMENEDNMNNALVCKKWTDLACNILWREVNSPRRLFSILAPMVLKFPSHLHGPADDIINIWAFDSTIGVSDWERFARYARRVRSFTLDETNMIDITYGISRDAFDEISRSRVSLNILPNLRKLVWLASSVERMRYSLMFQHENITHFSVFLHISPEYPIATFFDEVQTRMPRLTHLELRFACPVRKIEAELGKLLAGLPYLKCITLPAYTLSSRIIEELSKCTELETLQFDFTDQKGADITDVRYWRPQIQPGTFPALWDLSISATLPDVTNFLVSGSAPPNLTSFYIHILSPPPIHVVTDFFTAVAEHCPNLTHLYVDFFTSQDIEPTPPSEPRLSWAALRPVLRCPHLISFELRWDHPLDITQADIEELASNWPALETLVLNNEPMDNTYPSTLTLEAMLPFARHCPNLKELGLYMLATPRTEIPQLGGTVQSFTSLERLCVGLSSIEEPGHTALFLSQLCPPGVEISVGVTWPQGYGVRETPENRDALDHMQAMSAEWFQRWSEVGKMLPLLTKLRIEERLARKSLEKEVEDLKVRCQILSERAGVKMDGDGTCVPF